MKIGLEYESSQFGDLTTFVLSNHLLKTQWACYIYCLYQPLLYKTSSILNSTRDHESIYFPPIFCSFPNQSLLHAFYMEWIRATLMVENQACQLRHTHGSRKHGQIWTQGDCGNLHKAYRSSSQTEISAQRRGSGHKVPPLPKKLFSIYTCWEKEILLSPM